jgi:UDP-2,3-diacylglucosamine hydrolase
MTALRFDTARAPVLFIADLHLDPSRPGATRAFCRFLETSAPAAAALFILGDLFEAWVGDDARPDDDPVVPALAALAAQGTAVYFLPGNRDFLIGPAFCRAAGVTMLTEPTPVTIDDEPVLLEHGDALCTDDTAYQAFRAQVRDPDWQAAFLAQPVAERLEQARALRERSSQAMAGKSAAIMDVNADAVRDRFETTAVRTLIHGHTHRPAIHSLTAGDGDPWRRRIVLGDWFEQGSVLRIDQGEARLETLSFAE